MNKLTVYYPQGKQETFKDVKEIAISKSGIVFKRGKSPAKYKLNQLQFDTALLEIVEE